MQISRRNALMGASAAVAVASVPMAVQAVEPILGMEREWLAFREYVHSYHDRSDEALDPLNDRLNVMEAEIYETPAATPAGVAVKLRLWAYNCGPFHDRCYEDQWWRGDLPSIDLEQEYPFTALEEMGLASVMQDLERLAGEA